eukprot:COSAG02_NODE_23489_length_717_cov_0.987055_1_plen_30_part_10
MLVPVLLPLHPQVQVARPAPRALAPTLPNL